MHCISTFLLNDSTTGLFSSNLVLKALEIAFSQTALWCIIRQVLWVSLPRKKQRKNISKVALQKYNGGFIFYSSFTEPLLLCKQLYLNKILKCDCATFHLDNWLKHIAVRLSILIIIKCIFLTYDDKEHLLSS